MDQPAACEAVRGRWQRVLRLRPEIPDPRLQWGMTMEVTFSLDSVVLRRMIAFSAREIVPGGFILTRVL